MRDRHASSGPPGTEKPRRFLPRFHYELIACGLSGHELIGTEVAEVRPQDALLVRERDGLRWYRCVRCDSWLPLPPPAAPTRRHLPPRHGIELPLRGRPLRDKFVLRLIAVDRGLHFVILSVLAAAIFVFASHRLKLRHTFFRILSDLHGGVAGVTQAGQHGLLADLVRLFTVSQTRLYVTGAAVAVYAALEGAEMVGLWLLRRWAEYLTFVATSALLPLEVYELAVRVSPLKIVALVVNLAIVVYLLLAKRLFGLRGGGPAERRERQRDTGWQALERVTPSLNEA